MRSAQSSQILAFMQKGRAITPIIALQLFKCFRLGARVYDLKKAGHPIKSQIVHKDGKHFAQYTLTREEGL